MNLCARRARNLLASRRSGSHNLEIEAANYPTHVDLFSGIGGFALAAQWAGFRTIAFCEIDPYCQKVLAKNFKAVLADTTGQPNEGIHDRGSRETRLGLEQDSLQATRRQQGSNGLSRIHSNIFELDGTQFRRNGSSATLVTGGFPCQPFSVAGKRRGAADDRHLWPEMLRVIKEARPAWVLGENVPGIIPMELDNVLSDMEGIGYATRPFVIPACAVDARHRRDRLWIVGRLVADLPRVQQGWEIKRTERQRTWSSSESISDTARELLNGTGRTRRWRPESTDCCRWLPEPDMGRVAHGIPRRVDRLKGLGNAIVPQVAYEILREIRKLI